MGARISALFLGVISSLWKSTRIDLMWLPAQPVGIVSKYIWRSSILRLSCLTLLPSMSRQCLKMVRSIFYMSMNNVCSFSNLPKGAGSYVSLIPSSSCMSLAYLAIERCVVPVARPRICEQTWAHAAKVTSEHRGRMALHDARLDGGRQRNFTARVHEFLRKNISLMLPRVEIISYPNLAPV